ncbi:MAG: GNAT family N-acetyltransferase [Anaerolineae bacterium]
MTLAHPEIRLIIQDTAVPANVHFQLAKTADCRTLFDLGFSRQTFPQFRETCDRLLAWQANDRCCWLVARHANAIIGSGQLILYPHGSELANMFVAPPFRSQGIGTAMVTILTAVARKWGVRNLEISVAASNTRAATLYRRLGFSHDRHIKLSNQEAARVLWKEL